MNVVAAFFSGDMPEIGCDLACTELSPQNRKIPRRNQ